MQKNNDVSYNKYAFIVENEIFHFVEISSALPMYEKHKKTLSSNPIFIDVSLMPGASLVQQDWVWSNNIFFDPKNKKTYDHFLENEPLNYTKFIAVVDATIEAVISFSPEKQLEIAGFKSNPKIIEITDLVPTPEIGWIWNGSSFINPED
jgi:hypothetical protein